MVGSTVSHYEIQQKLGEGGMGVVYKARDTRLERFIALKILPAEKIADSERRQRFVREAKSASALNHPNIVTIHDIDGADKIYFIAMEYIEGNSLDRVIPRKGMRVADALRYAVQIADALGCAHRAAIVHRDLKPGNVMVTERGLIKVVDFGLAKLMERNTSSVFTSTETADAKADALQEQIVLLKRVTLWERWRTCHRSRPKTSRWTVARTFSRWAICFMKCSPANGLSRLTLNSELLRPFSPTSLRA